MQYITGFSWNTYRMLKNNKCFFEDIAQIRAIWIISFCPSPIIFADSVNFLTIKHKIKNAGNYVIFIVIFSIILKCIL